MDFLISLLVKEVLGVVALQMKLEWKLQRTARFGFPEHSQSNSVVPCVLR